jgi:Ca-activated chloride channel family protein
LTLTAGEELARFDSGMDFVFITDISGSMRDERKLAMSRILVKRFVDELGEKDRFELMTFNVASDALFDQLRDVTNDNRRQAASFMHSRVARGGTNLMLAVRTAYQYRNDDASRPLNVVILSDGMTEHKQKTELIQLIDERPKRTRVFCIGVGNEVNRPLLSQIADDSGGMAAFISRGDNFERAAKSFRQKLTRPMATDLAFKFSGVEVYDVTPRQIPNLYFGTPVRIYGRYKNGGDVTASLSANVIGKPINKSVTVELPRTDDANPEIDRMWAWHRVQGLLKQADRVGSRDSVVNAIIALGEGYSIVTEHTSFIVLENDAEYRRWKIDRRNAIRIERDRAGQDRLAKRLAELREKATTRLAPIGDDEPAVATPATPQVNTNNVPAPARQQSRRSRDIDFGFSGGAGAIDPVGGLIVLGMGGSALLARRRRRGSTIR